MDRQYLTECQFLLPLCDNNGRPVSEFLLRHIEHRILETYEGFTRIPNVEGVWRAPDGEIYRDCSHLYIVASQRQGEFLAFVGEIGALLQQKAMYVRESRYRAAILRLD